MPVKDSLERIIQARCRKWRLHVPLDTFGPRLLLAERERTFYAYTSFFCFVLVGYPLSVLLARANEWNAIASILVAMVTLILIAVVAPVYLWLLGLAPGVGEERADPVPGVPEPLGDIARIMGISFVNGEGKRWRWGALRGECQYPDRRIAIAPPGRWLNTAWNGLAVDAFANTCEHELAHMAAFGARLFDTTIGRGSDAKMQIQEIFAARRFISVNAEELVAEYHVLSRATETGRSTAASELYMQEYMLPVLRPWLLWLPMCFVPASRRKVEALLADVAAEARWRGAFLDICRAAGRNQADAGDAKPRVVEFLRVALESNAGGVEKRLEKEIDAAIIYAARDPDVHAWMEGGVQDDYKAVAAAVKSVMAEQHREAT